MTTQSFKNQTRYLSQAIQLEEAENPLIIRSTLLTVSAAIIAFIIWAGLTNINEVAHTPGEVVPQGFEQVVQHLEGGIVREILVREGDKVQKGQILMRLDGAGAAQDLERTLARQATLGMQEERLRSFSEGRAPDFSNFGVNDPAIARDQKTFFEGMMRARTEERNIVEEQIKQKERMIITLRSDLETARSNYDIAKDLYDRREELNRKGYTSDVQFLQTKQNLNSIDGDIKQIQNRISVSQAEIGEFRNRLASLDAKYVDDANERLDQVIADKSQNSELIQKLKDRVGRLDVVSPAHGLIKGLAFNTVGSVVQPGQTLMEIVPLDEQLMVEVRISPQHIGHLHVDQKVQVKFSSFDFSRYGFVTGKLDQISAATFTSEKGDRFYRGRIKLDKAYVGDNPGNTIVPGMTVMADIITGEKTVLEYLLKPIHLAMKTAFTER